MKNLYFKTFCTILVVLSVVLFYQQAKAATAQSQKASVGPGDTSQFQKPGRLKRGKKIKNEEKEQEDGVDDDIRARGQQEFLQQRDPKLNRIPLERLLMARQKRDEFLNNVKVRIKNAKPQNNVIKPSGSPTAPPTISNLQWHERGPNNVGGRTRALMFDMGDVANGYKRVFAGGVDGGLWVTSDITATPVQWTKINDFFDNIAISCIAQNPTNPLEIYAGTGEGFLNEDAVQGLGVWKSSDGGGTWTHLTSTVGFKYINAILVDKNGSVYVAGESAIFVGFGVDQSTDGGSTWTNVINSSEAGADLQMAANGDVYASTGVIFLYGHIYISDYTVNGVHTGNAGTWTNITPSTTGVITPATTSWNRIKLATAPSDANIVYGFFEYDYNSTSNLGLRSVQQYNKSANTWTVKIVPSEAFGNGQAWYSIAAAVDPNNPSVLYAGSLDAEKSIDGGSTWTQDTHWNYPTNNAIYVHADHHAYVYAPGSSTELIMGTDGGVFFSTNADATPSFVNKNNGYDVTQFYSVALHPTNLNYALAGAQDNGSQIFTSAGIGPTSVATGGDGADVFIDQTNGNIQVTSYVRDQYYVSTNNGVSFSGLSGYGNGQFINPTDYDASTKSLYAGSASGYYYRAENILSPAYNEVHVSGFAGANVMAVTVAPITANRVYFGLDNGNVVLVDNAQTGTSLTGVVLTPNGGTAANVSCVNVDPASEDHILVTYSNYGVTHIFETKNASAATPTWTDVSGNLPDMPVRWSLFYPGDPTKAIIATELGVWTTDLINGSSTVWDPTNTGLANVEVDMLKYRAADRTFAAATHGRGLFTSSLNSSNAALANLTISSGALTPAFSSGTAAYADAVTNSVTAVTVTPTTADPNAGVTINGTPVASDIASAPIALLVGSNTITTVVTAQDGTTTQTYTVTVTRAPSSNANLSSIGSSAGGLTPAFSSGTTSYSLSVSNAVATMTVKPVTSNANATIKVNGTATTSGTVFGPIALAEGAQTVISIAVTAQNGSTTKTYTLTVTRAPSGNANLAAIGSSIALTPGFSSTITSYTASVSNAVTSMTVKPVTGNANATIKVNGMSVTSGSASTPIALAEGAQTVITTVVTAQDGSTTKTYTLTVTRAPSGNANLSSIGSNAGALTPTFSSATTSYTLSVSNAVATMTVKPVTSDANATLKVNGTATPSGTVFGPIALAEGAQTVISIAVTSQDGSITKTYTVTVTRAVSTDATLSNIQPNKGTLTPAFLTTTTSYTVSEINSVSTITITPTATDANATIKVNGTVVTSGSASTPIALAEGAQTVISTVITAQNGSTTKTYTVTVTRAPSSNANLSSIGSNAGALTPTFSSATTSYTLSVSNAVASMTVKPVTSDAHATIKVNGMATTSGTVVGPIALAEGTQTVISIAVTAQDGSTTKTYTVTVTRAPSTDASLASLVTNKGTLSPAFATATTSYTTSVTNSVSTITVTPTTTNANAMIKVNGTAVTSGNASTPIALAEGAQTVISTVITAQNGTTTKTYTITVTRAPSSNANLSSIGSSAGALTPTFSSATTSYTLSVSNAVASMTVKPVTGDAHATLKVNGTATTSGTVFGPIALTAGAQTVISIAVMAQDGSTNKTYTLTVTRASGAGDSYNPGISVTKPAESPTLDEDIIVVHQGVSPNGDGINDFLIIDGIQAYPDNKLMIMNRNGQLIYETQGYDNNSKIFDGHSNKNGQMQLPGTYFYQLDYTVSGITIHKTGFIVLKY